MPVARKERIVAGRRTHSRWPLLHAGVMDGVIAHTEETEVGGSKLAQKAEQDPVSKFKIKTKK